MALIQFRAEIIRDLPFAEAGQAFYFDTKTSGLGVRVGRKKKVYFAEGRTRGKKTRVSLGSTEHLSLYDARKLAHKAFAEMADGINRNAENAKARTKGITLRAAAVEFFLCRDLKPKTQYDYERILIREFNDWADKPLKSVTPAIMVKRFDRILANSGKSSAALAVRTFRAIWNHTRHATADNDGIPVLPESPTQRITALRKMPKPVRRQEHVTDFLIFYVALMSVASDDFKAYFDLLIRTGARRSEISRLRWDDVDMKGRVFTFRSTKNGADHSLPMSPQIAAIFEALRMRHGFAEFVFGAAPLVDPRKSLLAFRKAYGKPLRAHDLRRTFANVAELCDVSETKLKALLNHSDQNVTHGYLVSKNPERLRTVMCQISDRIDEMAQVDSTAYHLPPNALQHP